MPLIAIISNIGAPFLVLQSDSTLAKSWLTWKSFSEEVQPPALHCFENPLISKDIDENYVTTMKKRDNVMHLSPHKSLQTRPTALKDMSCASQLLCISVFSPEKGGAFLSTSVWCWEYKMKWCLGSHQSQVLIQRRSSRKLSWMWLWLSGTQLLRTVLLKLRHVSESSGGLVKTARWAPSPEFVIQQVRGRGLSICISNKFSDNNIGPGPNFENHCLTGTKN